MKDETKKTENSIPLIPRVLADFGGRRKVFERRLKQAAINLLERRSGKDRRSGFDRRSTQNQNCEDLPGKRLKSQD